MTNVILLICIISFIPFVIYICILRFSKKNSLLIDSSKQNQITEISVILPCFNEAIHIERKINELLIGCKFLNHFEIIVISDGSTDSTNSILKKLSSHNNIKVHFFKERNGKAHALNFGVNRANHPIIVFSDARQTLGKDAIYNLTKCLIDEKVGAVSARLINGKKKSAIRSLVNYLKMLESQSGTTIGVYGCLYAIRKSCFVPIPDNTILDDLVIPLQINRMGKEVKFEKSAIAYDMEIESFYSSERVLRISRGLIQIMRDHSRSIVKLPLRLQFYLFCQKYYKLLLPFILIGLIWTSLLIVNFNIVLLAFFIMTLILFFTINKNEIALIIKLFFNSFLNLFKLGELRDVRWKK